MRKIWLGILGAVVCLGLGLAVVGFGLSTTAGKHNMSGDKTTAGKDNMSGGNMSGGNMTAGKDNMSGDKMDKK
jgi:pentapeptide MXKDX repeat protein